MKNSKFVLTLFITIFSTKMIALNMAKLGPNEIHLVEESKNTLFKFVPNDADFDESMGPMWPGYEASNLCRKFNVNANWYWKNLDESPKKFFDLLRVIYEKNKPSKVKISDTPRIPKIIHQVFFSKPIPEKFIKFQESWKRFHPDWQYILWDSENIKELENFPNKDYFDKSNNFAEKTDILRYVLLEKFGGVYADMDCECFEPFDFLHYAYDFYTSTECYKPFWVNLALVGAAPHHPVIQECIKNIRKYRRKRNSNPISICLATGPAIISKSFWNVAQQDDRRDIIFPASYFCPHVEWRKLSGYGRSETFSIHYFAGSWL